MIFHAKSLLGTEKVMTTKICQFQFHTSFAYNYLSAENQLKFCQKDLDCLDAPDKYPDSFQVWTTIEYKNIESAATSDDPWTNTLEFESQIRMVNKNVLFNNLEEMNEMIRTYESEKYSDTVNTPSINIHLEEPVNQSEDYNQLGSSHHSDMSSSSDEKPKTETKFANLLDFDDFGETNHSVSDNLPTNQSSIPESKISADFDILLDLGPSNQSQATKNDIFDIFSNSAAPISQNNNDLFNFDSVGQSNEAKKPSPPNNLIFDPFGNFDISTSNKTSNSNTPNVSVKSDPFAELNAFATASQMPKTQSANTKTPSPTFDTGFNRPNYNINAFAPNVANSNANKPSSGLGSKNSSAIFDEFLPSNFAKSQNMKNMTLKDLKREQDVKEMDPDKVKVMEWTDGKRANIRALLCSLHKVLWDGESRWKPVGMNQLISAVDVKKAYHKACLCVHPDKMSDHPQANLARMIFVELNDAWAQFQNDGQQNLF